MQFAALIPDDAAAAAIRRADAVIQTHGIACEKPVKIEGDHLVFRWDTHRSNLLIMCLLVGMSGADTGHLPNARITEAMRCVPGQDGTQHKVLNALAGHSGDSTDLLYDCVQTIIKAEGLANYFEYSDADRGDDPRYWHYAIRPAGYEAARLSGIKREAPIDVFAGLKEKAQAEKLEPLRRVALLALLSLYNSHDPETIFKGRGWAFHGAAVGAYCADRLASNPAAAVALLRACVVYPGW